MKSTVETTKSDGIVKKFTEIGASHTRQNKPNQDSVECARLHNDKVHILSVSDGHGSSCSFRSQDGSKIAVDTAIQVSTAFFRDIPSANELKAKVDILCRRIIYEWKQAVRSHLDSNPFSEDERNLLKNKEDIEIVYGATLLLAVVTLDYTLYVQLGDGNIFVIDSDNKQNTPIIPDDIVLGNDTHSLCEKDADKYIQFNITPHHKPPYLVFLTTDGLPNSFSSDKSFFSATKEIYEAICEHGLEVIEVEIPKWLEEYTRQGSGDDITIVFYYREKLVSSRILKEDVQESRRRSRRCSRRRSRSCSRRRSRSCSRRRSRRRSRRDT